MPKAKTLEEKILAVIREYDTKYADRAKKITVLCKSEMTKLVQESFDDLNLPQIVADRRVNDGLLDHDFITGANEAAGRLDKMKVKHVKAIKLEIKKL